jgi:F-type H+-transporting ATPase subunit delta
MGSATREALRSSQAALGALDGAADLRAGVELLSAGRVIGHSKHLMSALGDPAAPAPAKRAVVERLFNRTLSGTAKALLTAIVENRWSNHNDLLAGIEELGIRVIASSVAANISVEKELFEFSRIVTSDAELELALGSKLGPIDSKLVLVDTLLRGKFSEQTIEIIKHLLQQPRGRRIGELFRIAGSIVADQAGFAVAIVTTANPIAITQLESLEKSLAHRYQRQLRINQIIDPTIVGGVRVQIGNDVIDGSISSRINDLRLQLAG